MSILLEKLEAKLISYKVVEFHHLYATIQADNSKMNSGDLYALVQKRHNILYLAAEHKRKSLRIAIKREIEDIEICKAHILVEWGIV